MNIFELYNPTAISGIITFISIIIVFITVMKLNKRMKSLNKTLMILADKISTSFLDADNSIELFRIVMQNHVNNKIDYINDVLTKNDIENRKQQIQENIKSKFDHITQMETDILSKYNSICGDMGQYLLESVDWDEFYKKVNSIVFSDFEKEQKIEDLKNYMQGAVEELAKGLREKARNKKGA